MSELNGGADALGTAMLVSSLGGVGVGAALLLTPPPPPQPAKAAAATSNTVINGYFILRAPFPTIFPLLVHRVVPDSRRVHVGVEPHVDQTTTASPDSRASALTEYCIQFMQM